MRAIACLLLGLLALTAARPACATTLSAPAIAQTAHGHCPDTPGQAGHHACTVASCVGCALFAAPVAWPISRDAITAIGPTAAPSAPLGGLHPAAAIPPPRPLA